MSGFSIFRRDCVKFENVTFCEYKIAVRHLVTAVFQTRQLATDCKRFHAVKLSETIVMLRQVHLFRKSARASFQKGI